MEWRHRGTPPPQIIPSAKIRWKSSLLNFGGSRAYPPHWFSSKGPNNHRGVLLISTGVIEGYFVGKPKRGISPSGSCCCTTIPRTTEHLKPRRNCLDHPPYSPDLAPSEYHVYAELKNNWSIAIFRPTLRSLLPRRPGLTDKDLNYFFEWLKKVRAKKCFELRGECVE